MTTPDPNKLRGHEFEVVKLGPLSFQQARVVVLSVDRGYTAKEIADLLHLSQSTVIVSHQVFDVWKVHGHRSYQLGGFDTGVLLAPPTFIRYIFFSSLPPSI